MLGIGDGDGDFIVVVLSIFDAVINGSVLLIGDVRIMF